MTHFTDDFLEFFKELAANNNREWFGVNKNRYELSVKEPFEHFVSELIERAAKEDERFLIEPKQAIYRIYRDVRFSKDKTPYKLNASAMIAPGGRKSGRSIPGMYLELGPAYFRFYSGLYKLEKETLYRVRNYIATHNQEFEKLITAKEFVQHFGELKGKKNKVLPKELKAAAEAQPYIFNKQFYFYAELAPETILSENFSNTVMRYFKITEPLRTFLTNAVQS